MEQKEIDLYKQVYLDNLEKSREHQLEFMKSEYEKKVEDFNNSFDIMKDAADSLALHKELIIEIIQNVYSNAKGITIKAEYDCSINLVFSCVDESLHEIQLNLEKGKKYDILLMAVENKELLESEDSESDLK